MSAKSFAECVKPQHCSIMARISEYNVSFQTEVQILRRNVLNVTEGKTERPPFFLPQMKRKETSTKTEERQTPDIELDVRGLGGKTDSNYSFINNGKRREKRTRQRKIKVNSFSSPSNEAVDHKSPAFSLPPIDSKSLTHHHTENIPGCSNTQTILPHQEFELAFNTLMSVIERKKEEQKRTTQRFQRNIVQGEHKPINEKLHSPDEAKDGCSPDE